MSDGGLDTSLVDDNIGLDNPSTVDVDVLHVDDLSAIGVTMRESSLVEKEILASIIGSGDDGTGVNDKGKESDLGDALDHTNSRGGRKHVMGDLILGRELADGEEREEFLQRERVRLGEATPFFKKRPSSDDKEDDKEEGEVTDCGGDDDIEEGDMMEDEFTTINSEDRPHHGALKGDDEILTSREDAKIPSASKGDVVTSSRDGRSKAGRKKERLLVSSFNDKDAPLETTMRAARKKTKEKAQASLIVFVYLLLTVLLHQLLTIIILFPYLFK